MATMAAQGKRHRFIYIATAFVALLFMGLIYAWSLFVEPIETGFGWERAQTSLIFTLSMISFSVGMVVAGIIEQRFSPRIVIVATAIIIAGGFIAAAQTTTLLWIYITYGIIVGFGVGVGTDCIMSVAVKWHPDKQGIASGGMLMGFGMGAMLLSPLVTVLLGKLSWQTTFLILGVVFGVVMLAVALIMKLPPAEFAASVQSASNGAQPHEQKRDYSAVEMIKTRSFQLAFLWLILVSSEGLGLISQAVPAAEKVLSATGMDAAAPAGACHASNLDRLLRSRILGVFGRSRSSACAFVRHQATPRDKRTVSAILSEGVSSRSLHPAVFIMGGPNR